MEQRLDPQARCATMVAVLNAEFGWQMSATTQQQYIQALPRYMPDQCYDFQLRQMTINYHLDHNLVEALIDWQHTGHEAAWLDWMTQVVRVLRYAGIAHSDDRSFDIEDLAQVARADLAHALPSFRYASRLSTWAHQVIIHSARRVIRDSQAGKRAGRPGSLDGSIAFMIPASSVDHPETVAAARALSIVIHRVLVAQSDQRFSKIFRLWAEEDLSVAEVGQRVNLSPARVRVLIQQICQLLQQHPAIRSWLNDNETS